MASELSQALPAAIVHAQAKMLGDQQLYFVPIRHHSPACALALRALLQEVRPAAVLIEGPDDLQPLLALMQDARTVAPVAWLCQSTVERAAAPGPADQADAVPGDEGEPNAVGVSGDEHLRPASETRSAFYPFCDYSPEWIAVREGAALGAQLALIDLPWSAKAWSDAAADEAAEGQDTDGAASLMQERHFAHSRYLTAMATRLGCTDHHELWERLFELRPVEALSGDWRGFFSDVLAWCAMARQDYEPEVLEAELSLPRERHMAAHIRRWRDSVQGPIVVVTGGFHTLELLQTWEQAEPATQTGAAKKATNRKTAKTAKAAKANTVDQPAASATVASPDRSKLAANASSQAWLIRYSFDRLDALNGYSAGMPSPGYHQAVWERMQAGDAQPHRTVALAQLTALARQMRAQDQGEAASTALVRTLST